MYNFGNYELFREPEELDTECEYLYITDNEELKSNKWKIIIDHELDGLSVFDKCYRVRFNLFKYATTPICFYLDGSFQIKKSLRKFYEAFVNSNADLGLCVHPYRDNVLDEYNVWIKNRNYQISQFNKCMTMFKVAGYDPKYKGLYQGGLRICKNTELNKNIDEMVFAFMKKLGADGKIERLDQTIYSFVLNNFFENEVKIFPFAQQVFQGDYIDWKIHNTNITNKAELGNHLEGYVFNKKVKLFNLY